MMLHSQRTAFAARSMQNKHANACTRILHDAFTPRRSATNCNRRLLHSSSNASQMPVSCSSMTNPLQGEVVESSAQDTWAHLLYTQRQLNLAVSKENYALAAKLRDEIKSSVASLPPVQQFQYHQVALIRSGTKDEKIKAIRALGEVGDELVVPELADLLADPVLHEPAQAAMQCIFMRNKVSYAGLSGDGFNANTISRPTTSPTTRPTTSPTTSSGPRSSTTTDSSSSSSVAAPQPPSVPPQSPQQPQQQPAYRVPSPLQPYQRLQTHLEPAAHELLLEAVHLMDDPMQYDHSLAIFNRLIQAYPNYVESYNKRSNLLYMMSRFHESIEDCKVVLRLQPHHYGAASHMGLCYLQLGQYDEAIASFEVALKINPGLTQVSQVLSDVRKTVAGMYLDG